ncbi:MarR family winged helix-turn-helix transcriptional regulator [Kitasatospora sp. NPDC006697]|uniref:MarR family winged helix-turn-helix transcriptional regulator n=1 Tax=Kitasatospora sp. NPDC006697 TaxID=3364020 RepID=UPI0036C62B79
MSEAQPGPTAGYLVWSLSTKWRVAVDRAVAPLGLTHAQYVVLATLYGLRRSGIRPSQREFAERSGLEALYVSKLARALESAGLLDRTPDPADSRAVRLSLTESGAAAARQAIERVQQLLDQLLEPLGGLGSERTAAFTRDLQALLNAPLDLDAPINRPPQKE